MSVSVEPKIGTGTRQLAEFAVRTCWPCERCKGERMALSESVAQPQGDPSVKVTLAIDGPCDCTGDFWLAAAMMLPHDEVQWGVAGDYFEELGGGQVVGTVDGKAITQAELARVVARLLPLDVWPDTAVAECHH